MTDLAHAAPVSPLSGAAGFQAASRNLSATLADKAGVNVAADDLLKRYRRRHEAAQVKTIQFDSKG